MKRTGYNEAEWEAWLRTRRPESPEERAARMATPDQGLTAAAELLGLDLTRAKSAPTWGGPTPDLDDLEPVDDRHAQARADSRTVDVFGGGR